MFCHQYFNKFIEPCLNVIINSNSINDNSGEIMDISIQNKNLLKRQKEFKIETSTIGSDIEILDYLLCNKKDGIISINSSSSSSSSSSLRDNELKDKIMIYREKNLLKNTNNIINNNNNLNYIWYIYGNYPSLSDLAIKSLIETEKALNVNLMLSIDINIFISKYSG